MIDCQGIFRLQYAGNSNRAIALAVQSSRNTSAATLAQAEATNKHNGIETTYSGRAVLSTHIGDYQNH